jgi:hypothetical protein
MNFTPDPEYDLVKKRHNFKRGTQCGECGQKFEYGVSYAYHCPSANCPMDFPRLDQQQAYQWFE